VNEYGQQAGAQVLSELPVGVWVARAPGGEVLFANTALRAMMGVSDDAAAPARAGQGCGLFDRHGRPYPVASLPFFRAMAAGVPVVVDDMVIHRPDGQRVWVRAVGNPIHDARGVITHVVVAFTDITAEVRALVERAEIEKRLEVAVHHAPILLFTLDRNGVLTARDGALKPELERGAFVGVGASILDTYKDYPVVTTNVRRALAGETVNYSIDVRGLVLDVWLGPLRDDAGALVGAIGVCTDVTEGRKVQTQTIQNDRIRAMGTVAASVAHEINNPLTYVLAGLEETRRELAEVSQQLTALATLGDGTAAEALGRIARIQDNLGPVVEGTNRIREVTRELRTFMRPDDEQLADVDVASVVRSVLKLMRKEIEARARLVEDIAEGAVIRANEARLVQVLTNLLINAWQAIPQPDPARHVIGVRTAREGGEVVIEIRDSGTGVPAELRQRIFEPFVTTKDVGAGSGLGLFVCRNIVTSLRGEISLRDSPEGGALFRVALPLATPRASAVAPVFGVEARLPVPRPRILIIDDDRMVADALAARFARDAYDVRTILDGRQAVELVLSDRYDLVYCDVMMKDFGGVDLHEALRQRAPDRLSRVVFMTGGAFTPGALAFLDDRPSACVHKPFDIVADARSRLS
jgi:two-component system cell cycle sensor histidine kinase/response regulator CckA